MSQPISGFYYDGKSSQRHACRMYVAEDGFVKLDGISHGPMAFADLDIPSRVGNTSRTIQLPDGGWFETGDNQLLDALVKAQRQHAGKLSMHLLEHKWRFILPLLALCVMVVYLTVTKGIPFASEHLAHQLSADWSEQLGDSVLARLDDYYFAPSEMPKAVRQEYRQLLEQYLPADSDFEYTLYFRDGGLIGANAFALPDGSIVLTDQLIELADSKDEVLAVMLHEIGHVEHRHSLRALLESTGVAVLFTLLTGDAEFVQEFVVALPPLLLQAKFSRNHEWQADTYALERMQAEGLDPIHFATIMEKLTMAETLLAEKKASPDAGKDGGGQRQDDSGGSSMADMLQYLSTHPPSEARVDRFRQASGH